VAFEDDYRVIVPSYPFEITVVNQMADGSAAILDAEGIQQAHVLGGSYGGMVASVWCGVIPTCVVARAVTHRGPDPIGGANRRFIVLLRLLPDEPAPPHAQERHPQIVERCAGKIPFWELIRTK